MGADNTSKAVVLKLTLAGDEGNQAEADRIAQTIASIRARIGREAKGALAKEVEAQVEAARDMEATVRSTGRAKLSEEHRVAREQTKIHQQLTQQAERAAAASIGAHKQQREAALGASRGALDAVKGFALLGASTEQDTAKLLRMFAVIEGGFTAIRGLTDLWYKGAEAVRAYRAATAAAAVEQKALQAAQRQAPVSIGGRPPLPPPLPGGSGAAGTAAAAGTAGLSAVATAGLAAAVVVVGDLLLGLVDPTQSVILSFLGLAETAKERQRYQERLAAWEERHADRVTRHGQDTSAGRSARSGLISGLAELRSLSGLSAEQRSGLAQEDVRIAQQRLREFQSRSSGAGLGNTEIRQFVREEGTSRGQELADALRRQAEAQKEIVQAKREAVALAEREVETSQRLVEAAAARFKQEQKSFESREAAFGALTRGEQRRLKDISDRAQQGGITRADARYLQQSGFGGDLVTKFYAGLGRDAGGSDILKGLGEGNRLAEAGAELAEAQKRRADADAAAAKATAEVGDAMSNLLPTVRALEEVLRQLAILGTAGSDRGAGPGGQVGRSGIPAENRRRGAEQGAA